MFLASYLFLEFLLSLIVTVHKIKTLALKTVFYTNTQQFFDFYTHNPAGILHRLFIDWVPIKRT